MTQRKYILHTFPALLSAITLCTEANHLSWKKVSSLSVSLKCLTIIRSSSRTESPIMFERNFLNLLNKSDRLARMTSSLGMLPISKYCEFCGEKCHDFWMRRKLCTHIICCSDITLSNTECSLEKKITLDTVMKPIIWSIFLSTSFSYDVPCMQAPNKN